MSGGSDEKPDWEALYEIALPRGGFFRSAAATAVGFSKQLLHKHTLSGRMERAQHGVYRLRPFPPDEQDELISLWLWSGELGVFSHETALSLHQLSDALPSRVHMTVPRSWARRSPIPDVVALHHADIAPEDCTWIGKVPVTKIGRTLRDAVDAGVEPELISQAIAEGTTRKLIERADLRGIVAPARRGRRRVPA